MAEKVVAFVQARMGSSRLPGKSLLPLGDSTVLDHVLMRVSAAEMVDEVILVTTFQKNDLPLVKFCAENNNRVFCGSEDDVLDRFYQAAKLIQPDHIVRITADCPLMDPGVIDKVVKVHLESGSDYTSNVIEETYPDGEDVEIFKFSALKMAWEKAEKKSDREHVTLYIRNHETDFFLSSVKADDNYSDYRWTLDEASDYEFIKAVYEGFHGKEIFFMEEVLLFLDKNPELLQLNHDINRNEGLQKSLEAEKEE